MILNMEIFKEHIIKYVLNYLMISKCLKEIILIKNSLYI